MILYRRRCERQERHNAALTFIVGAHDEDDILERYDEHQRPEDRRQAAEHVRRVERNAVRWIECFLGRVERARANVAVNDAERGKGQPCEGLLRTLRVICHPSTPPRKLRIALPRCSLGNRLSITGRLPAQRARCMHLSWRRSEVRGREQPPHPAVLRNYSARMPISQSRDSCASSVT